MGRSQGMKCLSVGWLLHLRLSAKIARALVPLVPLVLWTGAAVGQDAGRGLLGAVAQGDTCGVEELIQHGAPLEELDEHENTPLLLSIITDRVDIAEVLLTRGANPNIHNHGMVTALGLAANNGNDRMVCLLLTHGADPNIMGVGGIRPLMRAAIRGHVQTMRILLESGAKVDATTKWGDTALILASQGDQVESVQLLLEHGAAPEMKNGRGGTALDEARRAGALKAAAFLERTIRERGN